MNRNVDYIGVNDYLERNWKIFNDYFTAWQKWLVKAKRYEGFYFNKQYTSQEIKALKSRGQAPIVINRVRPLIKQVIALLTANKPVFRITPQTAGDKEVAGLLDRLLYAIAQDQKFYIQFENAIRDMLLVGIGYIACDVSSLWEDALFRIKLSHLKYDIVFPDPNASDYNDSEHIVVSYLLTPARAQRQFNLDEEQMQEVLLAPAPMNADPYQRRRTESSLTENKVRVIDVYTKIAGRTYFLKPSDGELVSGIPRIVYDKLDDDLELLRRERKIEVIELNTPFIWRTITIGGLPYFNGIMRISEYPIVAFVNEKDEQDMPVGEIEFLEGIQRALNKFYSLTLTNAILGNSLRYLAPKGMIKNKEEFQRLSAISGAVIEYEPSPTNPQLKPEPVKPMDLPTGFYTLANDLSTKLEYEIGIYGLLLGQTIGTPDTVGANAIIQDYGIQRFKMMARRIDVSLTTLGNAVIQMVQAYAPENEILRFIVDNEQVEFPINQYIMDEMGRIAKIKNDLRLGKYDVVVSIQPSMNAYRIAVAEKLVQLMQTGLIPANDPEVLVFVLSMLDIPEVDKIAGAIMRRNEMVLQQLAQENALYKKIIAELYDEVLKLAKKLKIKDFEVDLARKLYRVSASLLAKERIAKKEIEMAKEKALENLTLLDENLKFIADLINKGNTGGSLEMQQDQTQTE